MANKKFKKLRRQIKKSRIERAKSPLVIKMEDATPILNEAVGNLPESFYEKPLREAVSGIMDCCRHDVVKILGVEARRLGDEVESFLRSRLEAVIEQFDARITNSLSPEILPDNCRFVDDGNSDNLVYVIEQKPQMRSLYFSDEILNNFRDVGRLTIDKRTGSRYKVALPYVIFIVHFAYGRFQKLYVFYRTKALVSMEDMLLVPNLPNIHDDYSVCFGSGPAGVGNFFNGSDPPAKQVQDVLKYFWGSMFNTDLSGKYFRMCDQEPRLKNLQTWVESSASDPMFVLNVPWTDYLPIQNVKTPLSKGGPLRVATQNAQEVLHSCLMGANILLEKVFKQVGGELNYNGGCFVYFKQALRQAVLDVSKTTIDKHKTKAEKVLRQAESERQNYLKMVQKREKYDGYSAVAGRKLVIYSLPAPAV